jgi:hypothetical protein
MAVTLIEVLTMLSITVLLSSIGIRQSRFYYTLLNKFLSRFNLPSNSPIRRQQIGTSSVFHNTIHGSYHSNAVKQIIATSNEEQNDDTDEKVILQIYEHNIYIVIDQTSNG